LEDEMDAVLSEYLGSDQAREEVATLIRERSYPKGGGMWIAGDGGEALAAINITPKGAWICISIEIGSGFEHAVGVHYRADGDSYAVTDLGDGVRALRVKMGILDITDDMRSRIIERCSDALENCHDCGWPEVRLVVDAADLPDAICRAMLASIRVASVGDTQKDQTK
jgi:hypothetical protein